jgi:hypothetical protein
MLGQKGGVAEDFPVRFKADVSAVRLRRCFAFLLLEQPAAFKDSAGALAAAKAPHNEPLRQGVDRLGADPVQPDAELKHIIAVLGARVDARHAVHHFAQRNAASEVTHRNPRSIQKDADAGSEAHDELVDGVVHNLLKQHVNAVIVVGTVPGAADVHPRPLADMLQRGERLDLVFVVIVWLRRHTQTAV